MEKDSKYRQNQINQQIVEENEQKIIICLRQYTNVLSQLYKFQALLYDKSLNLPRNFFKHFRNIHKGMQISFNNLEGYISFNGEFIQEKDKIIEEQINLTQSHISKGKFNSLGQSQVNRRGEQSDVRERKANQLENSQVQVLKGEIQALKNQLRRNDSEYQIEIKKYNLKYEEMLNDIRFYEDKMAQVEQYLDTIDKLEVQIRIMKEIKQRDQQLIRSMARKLKNYQVQKHGRSMLLSPSKPQRSFLSPSRMSSQLSPKRYSRY